MKNIVTKSFQYNYSQKKSTNVEFDIILQNGKNVARNIKITSNFRVYYPENPEIRLSGDVCGFYENGVFITNGDIQQIIKRICQAIEAA